MSFRGLARLAGRSVWIPGFDGRRIEPCSLPRLTLGEVGGLIYVALVAGGPAGAMVGPPAIN